MNTSSHILLETLVEIADGRLTGAAREAAMTHVATCSGCIDTLGRLERLIVTMTNDKSKDAPRDVLLSALNIFWQERQPRSWRRRWPCPPPTHRSRGPSTSASTPTFPRPSSGAIRPGRLPRAPRSSRVGSRAARSRSPSSVTDTAPAQPSARGWVVG